MQNNIHVSNCFDILKFADTYLCESLHSEAKKFLRKNFAEFVQSSMHLDLPYEVFTSVDQILMMLNLMMFRT